MQQALLLLVLQTCFIYSFIECNYLSLKATRSQAEEDAVPVAKTAPPRLGKTQGGLRVLVINLFTLTVAESTIYEIE